MVLTWSHWIFVVVNVISFPLYLLIIGVCVKEWKHNSLQRTFHLLGVVDLAVMASYFIFGILRSTGLFNSFYWTYQQYYIASWCFNQTYVMAFIRCFGVLLLSFQRYISLCRNGTHIEQIINVSHRWTLPLLQWTFPFLYSVPLLVMSNATFKDEVGLEILAEQQDIEVATSMAATFVSIAFFLCGLCYGAILKFLIVNRYSRSAALKRERRLYFQMLGLFVGFALLLIFNVMQFTFSLLSNVASMHMLSYYRAREDYRDPGKDRSRRIIYEESLRRYRKRIWGHRRQTSTANHTSLQMAGLTKEHSSLVKEVGDDDKLHHSGEDNKRIGVVMEDGPIFTMRKVFPVISCFFSYINVWMMITLNDDMRQKVLLLAGFRQPNTQSSGKKPTTVKAATIDLKQN